MLSLNPNDLETINNRGVVHKELGLYDEALADYDKAISLNPKYAEGHNNRGIALKELGRFDESLKAYNQAILLKPEYAEPYFNKSLQMLLLGDFKAGWPLYEWRWKTKQNTGTKIETSKPAWQGEAGKNVFLWAEQGIGDEIMYSSMIPELEKLCENLIVECDERLIPLFERSFSKTINFVSKQSSVPESTYDYHIPIASLQTAQVGQDGHCLLMQQSQNLLSKRLLQSTLLHPLPQ